eukprot:m.22166 g.22166  ORF g.22166 m.22166 type:complete len:113 (-) comp5770_c0_seq1:352-690(-)
MDGGWESAGTDTGGGDVLRKGSPSPPPPPPPRPPSGLQAFLRHIQLRNADEIYAKLDANDIDNVGTLRLLLKSTGLFREAADAAGISVGVVLKLNDAIDKLDKVHEGATWHD